MTESSKYELVKKLALLRRQVDEAKEQMDTAQRDMEMSEAGQVYLGAKGRYLRLKDSLETQDVLVRDAILVNYRATGEKAPLPQIGIRLDKVVSYDEGQAKDWCLSHLPDALKLDKPKYEKYIKAVSGIMDTGVAVVNTKPTVTISKDLSEYE